MSFVREQLREGESVVYETHLHKVIFAWPVFLTLAMLLLFVPLRSESGGIAAVPLLAALAWVGVTFIRYRTSEFAVTNRRVLIKTGLVSRKSMETNLTKVEGINVDQSIPGRLLGYGTILIRGTGGGSEPFSTIAKPMVFRRVVQEQMEHASALPAAVSSPKSIPDRPQRACPWCAEMILAEARICRYCQREVPPSPVAQGNA